jgi:pimeloyl-ACP methyl ester carboxylesterase
MPHAEINDTSLYYELSGKGKPIVLINGLSANHTAWDLSIKNLQKEYQVLTFDNRGAGKTKFNGSPFTLETLASDTIALIENLGLKKPHILGHSMGGAIAQIIGIKYKEKIDRIVLSSTSSKFNSAFLLFAEFFLSLYSSDLSSENKIKSFLPWGFSGNFLEKEKNFQFVMKRSLNNPYPATEIGFKRQLEALKIFDVRKSVSQIQSPVLLLRGEKDIIVLSDEMQFLKDNISDISFYNIKNAGHDHYIEKPEIFTKLVSEFFNETNFM